MSEKKKTILKTIDFIEKHLNDKLKLDDISNSIGYSKFHLNRLFQEVVGCTIHKYIKKRRLEEAYKRILNSDDSILDIAYDANYQSPQAFTLAFKKVYSYPPLVFRKLRLNSMQNKYIKSNLIIKNEVMVA